MIRQINRFSVSGAAPAAFRVKSDVDHNMDAAKPGDDRRPENDGVCLTHRRTVDADLRLTTDYYRFSDDQGDARAQFICRVCLAKGCGVDIDVQLHADSCKLSADRGDAAAHWNCGLCLEHGRGLNEMRTVDSIMLIDKRSAAV
jgi:TPR repeat protein